jgi:hypothetical protein
VFRMARREGYKGRREESRSEDRSEAQRGRKKEDVLVFLRQSPTEVDPASRRSGSGSAATLI